MDDIPSEDPSVIPVEEPSVNVPTSVTRFAEAKNVGREESSKRDSEDSKGRFSTSNTIVTGGFGNDSQPDPGKARKVSAKKDNGPMGVGFGLGPSLLGPTTVTDVNPSQDCQDRLSRKSSKASRKSSKDSRRGPLRDPCNLIPERKDSVRDSKNQSPGTESHPYEGIGPPMISDQCEALDNMMRTSDVGPRMSTKRSDEDPRTLALKTSSTQSSLGSLGSATDEEADPKTGTGDRF